MQDTCLTQYALHIRSRLRKKDGGHPLSLPLCVCVAIIEQAAGRRVRESATAWAPQNQLKVSGKNSKYTEEGQETQKESSRAGG